MKIYVKLGRFNVFKTALDILNFTLNGTLQIFIFDASELNLQLACIPQPAFLILMASMFEKCPPEIISAICKIIADDDEQKTRTEDETKFKSLRSCSQACGTLRTHCLQHIFHNVDIRDSYIPQDRTAEIFTELVSGAPEIADCVRVLRYGMRFHDDLHYAGVLSFLNKLTGLRSLTLSVHGSQRDWTGIPPSTQSSILKLIHLPTLVSLDLRLIEKLDINVLTLCPNLRGLHLHAVTFYDRRVPRPDEKEFLSVVTVDSIRTGQPVVDFPRLNSLSFWILKKEEVLWEEFILSSSPQLESLKMTCMVELSLAFLNRCH